MGARFPSGIHGPQLAGGFSPPWPMRWRVATRDMDSSACVRLGPWQGLFFSHVNDGMLAISMKGSHTQVIHTSHSKVSCSPERHVSADGVWNKCTAYTRGLPGLRRARRNWSVPLWRQRKDSIRRAYRQLHHVFTELLHTEIDPMDGSHETLGLCLEGTNWYRLDLRHTRRIFRI
jgi:hypothetical protein